jgi:ATP synthase protein I
VNTRSAAGPAARPARALLAGGAVPGAAVAVIVSAASAISSLPAAASALLGAALAAAALAVGPVVMMIAENWSPPAVMAAALVGYGVAVGVVGAVYLMVAAQDWVRGGYAGWAVLATVIAWIGGQIRATSRLRLLAFGHASGGDTRADKGVTGPDPGSPESPRQARH